MATARYHQQQEMFIEALFVAVLLPASSKATSSNVSMAVQKIMERRNSHISNRGMTALANVIKMRQSAMTDYAKGDMADAGHRFWLDMLIGIHACLKSDIEEQKSHRLRVTRQRIDLETGRTAVFDSATVSTSSIDQISLCTSQPQASPMSLEESGGCILQALGCRALQSIRDKVAEVCCRAASGTLYIVTVVQVSNICREHANSELQYLSTYYRIEMDMLQYPLITEILDSSKDRTNKIKIEASTEMFWPPVMRNQADHLVDRWLLFVARHSWDCSDRLQNSCVKLRLMLLMHVRQLIDVKNQVLPADKDQIDEFVTFAKSVLQKKHFVKIWALGHFCVMASHLRLRYEALNMAFYGMKCYILHRAGDYVESEGLSNELVQTLNKRGLFDKIEKYLFRSNHCSQKPLELCALIKKHCGTSRENLERMYKLVCDRELSFQLDHENFRSDVIVRHLNKKEEHASLDDDFKSLIDKIEQALAQDNQRVEYLCGQEWSTVKSTLGIGSLSYTDFEVSMTRSVPRCNRSFVLNDPDLGA